MIIQTVYNSPSYRVVKRWLCSERGRLNRDNCRDRMHSVSACDRRMRFRFVQSNLCRLFPFLASIFWSVFCLMGTFSSWLAFFLCIPRARVYVFAPLFTFHSHIDCEATIDMTVECVLEFTVGLCPTRTRLTSLEFYQMKENRKENDPTNTFKNTLAGNVNCYTQ